MSGKDPSKKRQAKAAGELGDGTVEVSALASRLVAQNPDILAAMQKRCNQLVGESSGYIESLPASVKRRIKALKNLQAQYAKVEEEFYLDVAALEAKFASKYRPLLDKRMDIISGKYEPTDLECEWHDDTDEEDNDDDDAPKISGQKLEITNASDDEAAAKDDNTGGDKKADSSAASDDKKKDGDPVKGVPDFWLTVFKNTDILEDMIKEHDEPVFGCLTDIKAVYNDNKGLDFTLEFHFSDNEYFANKVLTKGYTVECKVDDNDPFSFDGPAIVKTHGCDIEWKKGKNLTVKTVKKKQRHKGRGQTRTVTKTVPNESFFNFFSPPNPPDEDADEEDDEDYLAMETLEMDFSRAEFLKDRVIPQAVLYFTGEIMEDEDDVEEEEEGDDGEIDDEDDDEDDDDPEFDPSKVPKGQKPPECKQQ